MSLVLILGAAFAAFGFLLYCYWLEERQWREFQRQREAADLAEMQRRKFL